LIGAGKLSQNFQSRLRNDNNPKTLPEDALDLHASLILAEGSAPSLMTIHPSQSAHALSQSLLYQLSQN
jgi:hypothetical protein